MASCKAGDIAAMAKTAEILQKHDVHVEEVDLHPEMNDADVLRRTHRAVLYCEARSAFLMDYLLDVDRTKMNPKIRAFVDDAANLTVTEIADAVDRYAAFRSTFDEFAAKYSAVITPSAQDIAPLGIGDMGKSSFNFMSTGLHVPVIHVPAFTGEHGLPVGLSVIAGRFQDQDLLQICSSLSNPLMAEGGWSAMEGSTGPKF